MIKNLPNILTLTRILLLPFFVAAFMYSRYGYALVIFIVGGITDILDGLAARLTNQTTALGRVLDPIADKFTLVTSFVLMSIYGIIPAWITIVVISRDLIIITGCLILYLLNHNPKIEPTIFGKASNALQFILIGFALIIINIKDGFIIPLPLYALTAFCCIVSGLQYILKGMKLAHSENA
jgi:cardiolipin synthase